MNSISTKIKIVALIGIATLIGTVLYVKADKSAEDESLDALYFVRSSATTNLDATMKAYPRTNEYTSSEYSSKMAPNATNASEYLALYEKSNSDDFSYQDNQGQYRRRSAPTTIQGKVPDKGYGKIEGQRAAQSNSNAYESFGVRSAIVKSDTIPVIEEEEEEEDPRLQTISGAKQRVVGVDSYSKALKNAEANDNAYQTATAQEGTNYFGRYKVRSADRDKEKYADTTEDGYAKRRAPEGTNSHPVKDYANSSKGASSTSNLSARAAQPALATTDGYAQRRAPQTTGGTSTNLAQYENAKGNDKAYQSPQPTQSGETYGGYAVRSASNKSGSRSTAEVGDYSRRRAPQGTNQAPVKDYANSTKPRTSGSEYGGYPVRSAGGRDVNTAQHATSSDETYGGYAVRSAGKKSTANKTAARDMAEATEGGYARRRAPSTPGQTSTSLAQYENANQNDGAYKSGNTAEETYGGYAVRSAGKKSTKPATNSSREYAQGASGETYGGYAVRSAGKRSAQPDNYTAQSITPSKPRTRGGVPASTGLKIYGTRGEKLTASESQVDRSVIIMPKRGRSMAGIVIQEDPGKSIIVQSASGVQSTYRYGEIDALVNL